MKKNMLVAVVLILSVEISGCALLNQPANVPAEEETKNSQLAHKLADLYPTSAVKNSRSIGEDPNKDKTTETLLENSITDYQSEVDKKRNGQLFF